MKWYSREDSESLSDDDLDLVFLVYPILPAHYHMPMNINCEIDGKRNDKCYIVEDFSFQRIFTTNTCFFLLFVPQSLFITYICINTFLFNNRIFCCISLHKRLALWFFSFIFLFTCWSSSLVTSRSSRWYRDVVKLYGSWTVTIVAKHQRTSSIFSLPFKSLTWFRLKIT